MEKCWENGKGSVCVQEKTALVGKILQSFSIFVSKSSVQINESKV